MKIFTSKEINNIIEDFCRTTKVNKNYEWHYKYVVAIIYMYPYVDRRFLESDFVPINLHILRKQISHNHSSNILNNLILLGILESDNDPIEGLKSTGYRIIERGSKKWVSEAVKDKKLSQKIQNRRLEIKSEIYSKGKGYEIVAYWNELIEIDYKRAKKYIDNHFSKKTDQFSFGKSACTLIKDKEFFITVDNTSNRLHSNVTNLPTPLRQFLSVLNEKLYSIDIRCSQPTFLGLLMSKRSCIDRDEVALFLSICKEGQFYEYMAKKGELEIDLTDYETRKKFKQKIFSGCLFDVNRIKLSKWELIFQKCFPTIFTEVRRIKKTNYNAMAVMLQKEESKFIFKTVEDISKVIEDNNPLLTIHDSIISNKESIETVKAIMEQNFIETYKFCPDLTIESL